MYGRKTDGGKNSSAFSKRRKWSISCGLIGSEVSVFFARQGFRVAGIDDNHRAVFFGPEGDTSWVLRRLHREIPGYRHEALDIRDRAGVLALVEELRQIGRASG